MRKSIITVFCIFWVFCLLIGCSPETKGQNGDFEGNTIQSIGSATISGTGKIKIKGDFKAGDGVLIKPSTSRTLTRGEDGADTVADSESDTEYYQTDNGYYLVMAEEDGEVEIEPEKMDLSEGEEVYVGKFTNGNDFEITIAEYTQNNVRDITEEYYYADFTSGEFASLDKSDIIVRQTTRSGGGKICIITRKNGIKADVKGSVDYSSETGIGILQSVTLGNNSDEPPAKVHMVNPINLSVGDTGKKLTDLFSIIRIKADSFESGKEYCLQITGVDSKTIAVLAGNGYFRKTLLRNKWGSHAGLAIPYFSAADGTITYYIGSFTEDRTLDIDFENFYTGLGSVNYNISIIEKPDNIPGSGEITDITPAGSTEVTLKAPYDSTDYITVAFKGTEQSKVAQTSSLKDNTSYGYFYRNGAGKSGFGDIQLYYDYNNIYVGTLGYFVINLKEEIKKGDEIAVFKRIEVKLFEIGHVYVFDKESRKYVSSSGVAVNGVDLLSGRDDAGFVNGTFVCTSEEEKLAGLNMKNGFFYCNDEAFGHGWLSSDGTDDRTVQYGYKEDDPSVYYYLEVDEFRYMSATDKSVTGTMILLKDNTEIASFKNVSFVWTASTEN